jgi:hypothetical protein
MVKGLYGAYKIPSRIKYDNLCIDVDKTQDNITYRRECAGEKIERLILSSDAQLHINPIEPLNLPEEITPYLLIEFETPLFVEPKQTREIFLAFPVEIGVYIYGRRNFEIIDILTLARKKLTLYGRPQSGVICKYWKSNIWVSKPSLNALHEGILRVKVRNLANVWSEITRIVLNAYGMKIYYDDKMVCMNANMRVLSKTTAETDFIDSPISKKMKKSLELYKLRKLPIVSAKFVMEEGM